MMPWRLAIPGSSITPPPDSDRPSVSGSIMSQSKMLHQDPGELGSLARFFVFEIDEDIAAQGGIAPNRLRPPLDGIGRIAFVAQPEVGVIGGHRHRSRQ